ncbi:MAG: phosphatidate cytidylyltransferase [Gammaproteobacteria bacterium]|nr:phosphatidate cytidylyltransferase [Gammaproteobacteria bacterium]
MLGKRIATAVVLGLVIVGAVLVLDTWLAALVLGFFWLVGAWEWGGLAGFGTSGRLAVAAAFAAIVFAVLFAGVPARVIDTVLFAAAGLWVAAFVAVLRYPPRFPPLLIAAFGIVLLAAAWLAFYRVHLGVGAAAGRGPALILAGLVIVWCADIGAYFAGRRFGRAKLAPRVSPGKTWEGVAGGVALAIAAGFAAAWLVDRPPLTLALVAAAMALISVVGDLSVSLLKRWAGWKDSGVLLPGHGGVLDRFDGVTAALPFFALGLQFAHVLD